MNDKDTYDALLQAVCDEPDVPLHKLALADYFGERGDELRQAAWRELKEHRPGHHKVTDSPTQTFAWLWYSELYKDDTDPVDQNKLLVEWLKCMKDDYERSDSHMRYNESQQQAFLAAVEGYVVWKGGKNT